MERIGPKTYVIPSSTTLAELWRISVIVGGIAFFVFAGTLITFGEWITGKGYDDEIPR